MRTPVRIGAFVATLAVLFAAFGLGTVFDDDEPGGYTLRAELEVGGPLLLRILDPDGRVVEGYETRHEKQLHLIAVRKDFGDYQHLHPAHDGSGGWTVADADLGAGDWRLYADFQPTGGDPRVAYDDLSVAGTSEPAEPAAVTDVVTVDGYDVGVRGADSGALTFSVSRGGVPVTDLEPYLGAYGHLVVIREGDLRFLHVHPDAGPAGPEVSFGVADPTPGRYRAYVEFQHDGVVRTAPFSLDLGSAPTHEEGGHGDH